MKKILLVAMFCLAVGTLFSQPPIYVVNAVIGDESFVQTFGTKPNRLTNEVLRIQTHLFFVENKLRNTSPQGLSKKQKIKRKRILNLLHEYSARGLFPSNYHFPEERKPCFIDRDGKICAVGFLIAETEGMAVAEKINSLHQYEYILNMNEEVAAEWAKENGLTLEECAMIQPAYGGIPTSKTVDMPVKSSYGISSGFIGGTNIAINVCNLSNRFSGSKTIGNMGLISGTAQVVLGLANIRKQRIEYEINGYSTKTSYQAQNNLSYINIAAGAATLFSSAFNLYLNKNKKDEVRNKFSLYTYPDINQQMNMGVSIVRKL